MRSEIRFAGFGGQGIALAGYITGKAAAVFDGRQAVLRQNYGPESRGGASASEVILADAPIDYPALGLPNCLVLMSREARITYGDSVAGDATVILDSDLVEEIGLNPRLTVRKVPATRLADELGRRIVANMVMLGFFTAVTGLVSREAMEEAIRTTVPPRTIDLNLNAFASGFAAGVGQEVTR